VSLANTRQLPELPRVLIADRGDTRPQLALHQMPRAPPVQHTQIRLPGARPWLYAFATLGRRGRTEDRARNVWREPTKHRQEPTLAVIAAKASTPVHAGRPQKICVLIALPRRHHRLAATTKKTVRIYVLLARQGQPDHLAPIARLVRTNRRRDRKPAVLVPQTLTVKRIAPTVRARRA
jgi:hypothetical protein